MLFLDLPEVTWGTCWSSCCSPDELCCLPIQLMPVLSLLESLLSKVKRDVPLVTPMVA